MPTTLTAMSMPNPYFSGMATNSSSRYEIPSQKATMRNRPTGVAAEAGTPRLIVLFCLSAEAGDLLLACFHDFEHRIVNPAVVLILVPAHYHSGLPELRRKAHLDPLTPSREHRQNRPLYGEHEHLIP